MKVALWHCKLISHYFFNSSDILYMSNILNHLYDPVYVFWIIWVSLKSPLKLNKVENDELPNGLSWQSSVEPGSPPHSLPSKHCWDLSHVLFLYLTPGPQLTEHWDQGVHSFHSDGSVKPECYVIIVIHNNTRFCAFWSYMSSRINLTPWSIVNCKLLAVDIHFDLMKL